MTKSQLAGAQALYSSCQKNVPIAERLQMAIPQVKSAIQSLFEKGVVDTDKVDTFAAHLTPEGYDLTRRG